MVVVSCGQLSVVVSSGDFDAFIGVPSLACFIVDLQTISVLLNFFAQVLSSMQHSVC